MDWIRREQQLRALALGEFARQGGYFDENGRPVRPAPAPPPVPSPTPITTVRRPRIWPKGQPRFDALPDTLNVPADLQTLIPHRTQMYVAIAESAHLLCTGHWDLFVIGGDGAPGIAYGDAISRWVLTLVLKHAPDDDARANVVQAVARTPELDSLLLYAHLGANAFLECMIASGTARHYRAALEATPLAAAMLQAAVEESGSTDPDIAYALQLPATSKRAAGHATRCANALWEGRFPSELELVETGERVTLALPSWIVLKATAAQASGESRRQGLIRAFAGFPGFTSPRCAPLAQCLALAMAQTHPDEFRNTLAAAPELRRHLAHVVQTAPPATDEATEYVVGLRDSH